MIKKRSPLFLLSGDFETGADYKGTKKKKLKDREEKRGPICTYKYETVIGRDVGGDETR